MPGDLDQWIKEAPFRFAKTMPDNPHWYVTERDERQRGFGAELRAFLDHVGEHGCTRCFEGYPYRMITLDDHDYWLTWGQDCGAIINRKQSTDAGWDDTTPSEGH